MIGPVKLGLVFFLIRVFLCLHSEGQGNGDTWFERRLIRLIFAGWVPHDLIRRGLPLSSGGRAA
jgi:hypothetical protein